MNGKDIFLGLKFVDAELIEEAEFGKLPMKELQTETTKRRRAFRRPFLLAALIALMLLIVGCGIVYVLSLKDVKIGEATTTRDYRLVDGIYVEDPHEVSQNVLTLAGLKGSNAYQACLDFYLFKEEYTKNMEAMIESGTLPEGFFEDNTYSKTMDAKAEELAVQYNLKLEGERLDFRTTRNMCDALGIERFLRDSEEIKSSINGGTCYENGNFYLYFGFDFPEDRGYEVLTTSGYLRWNRTDCFSRDYVALVDNGDWIERNYTTASGSEVLILQSPTQERGYILCDRGDALMSLQLDVNIELLSEENGVVSAEYQHMTDRQIELVADVVDFTMQPKIPTQADVQAQADIPQMTTQNGWTIGVKSVETDGYVTQILLNIAAPEGTVIPTKGNVIFANHGGELLPENGGTTGSGGGTETRDDGDGLDNTVDLLLERDCTIADGSAPFAAGTTWNLHMIDIVYSDWDTENCRIIEETLVEGEWLFPISFDATNGDYREIELIQSPVATVAAGGTYMDGTDAEAPVNITSFRLRKFGATIEHDGESYYSFSFINGKQMCAVMKDGTKIGLLMRGGDYVADSTIDLEQVDHVLLPDGTKLTMPK